MHDRNPKRSIFALMLPAALALTAGWVLWGDTLRDAVYAALKLVVIR